MTLSPLRLHRFSLRDWIASVFGSGLGGARPVTAPRPKPGARTLRVVAPVAAPEAEPGSQEGPVPGTWTLGRNAPSANPLEVRTFLLQRLFELADQSDHEGDVAFLKRLVRTVGTEALDLPPFPDVARQLDRLLRQRDVPIRKVARLAEREPALVKRIWQQACGLPFTTRPTNFQNAVARLGFDTLWQIAMRTCMYDAVFRVRGYEQVVKEVRAHGIVAAELATWVASETGGQTYLAGLLHDVGKLLVYRAASCRPRQPAPRPELVEQIALAHHASLGVLVSSSWKLGEQVSAGIAFHHNPAAATPAQQPFAWVVHVADIAVHTAANARAGVNCGGLLALLEIDAISFDPARTIAQAHTLFDQLDSASETTLGKVRRRVPASPRS